MRSALRCLHRLNHATVDLASPYQGSRARLVQRATRKQSPDNRPASLAHAAADALLQGRPDVERDTPFAKRCAPTPTMRQSGYSPKSQSGYSPSGQSRSVSCADDRRDPAGAATALEELLADMMEVLCPDHPDTFTARSSLAYWHERKVSVVNLLTRPQSTDLRLVERIFGPRSTAVVGTSHGHTIRRTSRFS